MDTQEFFRGLASYFCLLIIVTVHEFGHAFAAVRLGDDTPRLQGRITLNPIAHMDLIGTVILPLAGVLLAAFHSGLASLIIGWGKPVQFNLARLRDRHTGPLLIAMAGPLMNVVIAVIAIGLMHLGGLPFGAQLIKSCAVLAELSMLLFFFNLLPIPPLDGSYVLKHLTGMSWEAFHTFGRYGLLVIILALQWQPLGNYLVNATGASLRLFARILGIPLP